MRMTPAEVEGTIHHNVATAFDMSSAYPSVWRALDSYRINVADTLREYGADSKTVAAALIRFDKVAAQAVAARFPL